MSKPPESELIAGSDLTLVLFGDQCPPQSSDLLPFWRGFIELQKRLPTEKSVRQIVAHSWNPDLAGLARAVYAPQAERYEHQGCLYPEFIQQIEPPDRFERGVERMQPTWKDESIQSVLGNARSRARAVQLMDQLPIGEGQVLITRWDLGQAGGDTQVNQLVADAALPEEYLYLSYSSEVDKGYTDMWVLAPWQLARRFGCFDAFVLDALAGRNRYLESFTETGWPRARVKTRFETVLSHPLGQRGHAIVTRIVRGIQEHSRGGALLQRVVRRLTGPVQRFLSRPPVTAENSCVPGFEHMPPVFPAFQALNIHVLLKYFIFSEGLRDRTRFLTHEDFEITAQSGQLLNPQPIVLLVCEADDPALVRLLAGSPLPLSAIYQLGKGVVREHLPDGLGGWATTMLQPATGAPRDQMACALSAVESHSEGRLPVLLMPTVDRYLRCADWFYLNALMKYIAWRDLGYVGLDCAWRGRPHLEFPDLHMVRCGGGFSLFMAAGTAAGIRAFLDVADLELVDVCNLANRMRLEFLVVARGENLF